METQDQEIIVYGTNWCGDSYRARSFLERNKIAFRFVDIDKDPEAEAFVIKTNRGFRSVPTIVFKDGSTLTEPSDTQLAQKLGIPARSGY